MRKHCLVLLLAIGLAAALPAAAVDSINAMSNFDSTAAAIVNSLSRPVLSGEGQDNWDTVNWLRGASGYDSQSLSAITSYGGLSNANAAAVTLGISAAAQSNIKSRVGVIRQQCLNVCYDDVVGVTALNSDYCNRVWVSGLGLWQEMNDRNSVPGYRYDSGGAMIGYDRAFGPVAVGGSFGWNSGKFHDRAALANNSTINTYAFNLYGLYNHESGFFVSVDAGYAYTDYEMSKTRAGMVNGSLLNGIEQSEYNGDTWNAGLNIGYDLSPTDSLTITPSIGFSYIHTEAGDFDSQFRTGGGVSHINVAKLKGHSTALPVELDVKYRLVDSDSGRLTLSVNGGYAYQFNNRGATGSLTYAGLPGRQVNFEGRAPGRNTWNAGAGLRYECNRFELGVKYDYYAREDFNAHRLAGTVGISF